MKKEQIREKLAAFDAACRTLGLKLTHQRREIYQELICATDHPSVETVHRRLLVRIPTVSLDTIYRTLATLEQHGLVKRVQTMASQTRYEAMMIPHHHFVCDRCQKIVDFEWHDFDQSNLPELLSRCGRIREKNVIVQGTCNDCLGTGN